MNHWEGKLWYAYGTSMTSIKQGKYVPVVQALSGLQVVNHGIPGGSITPKAPLKILPALKSGTAAAATFSSSRNA